MAYTFADAGAKSRRVTQYSEMLGNQGIYHDGWTACTTPPVPPWSPAGADVDVITGYQWELYNTDQDFSQADNLAATMPEKLLEMRLLFYTECARFNVLPLDNSKTTRLDPAVRPSLTRGRTSFAYSQGMTRIPEGASPDMKNRSYAIAAQVDVKEGASGMIVTQGGLFGGTALYLDKGRPIFHYNFVDVAHYEVAAKDPLAPGKHTIRFEFAYDGGGMGKGGTGTLVVHGGSVARGRIERTPPIRVTLDESLDVGEDTGTPVNLSYDVPFKFTGTLNNLMIDLK